MKHIVTQVRVLYTAVYLLYTVHVPVLYISNSSTENIKETAVGKTCALNGVQKSPNVKRKDEILKEKKQDLSHRKEMIKGLTHSGSGVLPETFCHSNLLY